MGERQRTIGKVSPWYKPVQPGRCHNSLRGWVIRRIAELELYLYVYGKLFCPLPETNQSAISMKDMGYKMTDSYCIQ